MSRPLQPDYLFFNYLSYPVVVKDKTKEREAHFDAVQLRSASLQKPTAAPIIISNYNLKKSLEIIINESEKIKYRIDEPIMKFGLLDKSIVICSSRVSGTIRIIEIKPF